MFYGAYFFYLFKFLIISKFKLYISDEGGDNNLTFTERTVFYGKYGYYQFYIFICHFDDHSKTRKSMVTKHREDIG